MACLSLGVLHGQTPPTQVLSKDTTKTAKDTSYWKKGGLLSLSAAQTSLTNWSAGGDNSIALGALFSGHLRYEKSRWAWDNNLDLGYGLQKLGVNPLRKSDDKMEINSKLGYKTATHWYLTLLGNFKSQFSKGYDYTLPVNDTTYLSKFLAPGYVTVALGMDWKPNDVFALFLSPLAGKFTLVNDPRLAAAGAFGVDSGKMVKSEMGAYLNLLLQAKLMDNVNLKTKLDLFTNYLDPKGLGNVDVNWENILSLKVNKLISVTVTTNLIYDNDIQIQTFKKVNGVEVPDRIGPRTQFKEVVGVGFAYVL